MAEFVFNGNANIYSSAGSTFGTSTAQPNALGQQAAAAAVNTVNNDDQYLDSNLPADRQIELLLWLSNLELRLPPYGDVN